MLADRCEPLARRLRPLVPGSVRPALADWARRLGLLHPLRDDPCPDQDSEKFPLQSVMIGTSGQCNASCVHCPTNKAETGHLTRGVMPMATFQRIIDQIKDEARSPKHLGLGLHGDSLLDPLIVERCRYVRRQLPKVSLCVNTNGAAYARSKHQALYDCIDLLSLHIESLRPAVYNSLMRPLRLENVAVKIEMILQDFGQKTWVSVPVSRLNQAELPDIEAHFLRKGAHAVYFQPLYNRCSPSPEPFHSLAFGPRPVQCGGSITQDLIIDWNGDVLTCCNDFAKKQIIGDANREPLVEILHGQRRTDFAALLNAGRWAEIPSCSQCQVDCFEPRVRHQPKTRR